MKLVSNSKNERNPAARGDGQVPRGARRQGTAAEDRPARQVRRRQRRGGRRGRWRQRRRGDGRAGRRARRTSTGAEPVLQARAHGRRAIGAAGDAGGTLKEYQSGRPPVARVAAQQRPQRHPRRRDGPRQDHPDDRADRVPDGGEGPPGPFLVIVPLATLSNWQLEFAGAPTRCVVYRAPRCGATTRRNGRRQASVAQRRRSMCR